MSMLFYRSSRRSLAQALSGAGTPVAAVERKTLRGGGVLLDGPAALGRQLSEHAPAVAQVIRDVPLVPEPDAAAVVRPGLEGSFGGDPSHRDFRGRGVAIGLIDAGVCRHPAFGERLELKDCTKPGVVSEDRGSCGSKHATMVGGVAGGCDRCRSWAPEATLVSLRCTSMLNAINAIDYLCRRNSSHAKVPVRVLCIPREFAEDDSCEANKRALRALFDEKAALAQKAGVILCASAGNVGAMRYPALSPRVIAVGGYNGAQVGALLRREERVLKPDLLTAHTPRKSVCCQRSSTGCRQLNAHVKGTSGGVGYVASMLAVWCQIKPAITADEVAQLLQKHATPKPSLARWGVLNSEQQRAVLAELVEQTHSTCSAA